MIVAGAATSILSLYVIPAFADSPSEGTLGVLLGALSGPSVSPAPVDGPANACPHATGVSAAPGPSYGDSCTSGPDSHGSQGAAQDADHGDGREHGGHGPDSGHDGVVGYDGDSGHDGVVGYDDDGGYGDNPDTPGGDGDTPPTSPPTTPLASPPTTPPPTATPLTPEPPATPPTTPSAKPPAAGPPAQPPSLAHTGDGELAIVGSGVAALLMTSGVILYRRGRAASRW
ncbi:hypothetical protein ABZV31_18955 [Streptomyces sp. NPDC005202]|uniref:hypothetical protein n=1 Tax=Streptomyces sp. NPDC005202 TaxID=3157021 RepID=UPI0033B0881F